MRPPHEVEGPDNQGRLRWVRTIVLGSWDMFVLEDASREEGAKRGRNRK